MAIIKKKNWLFIGGIIALFVVLGIFGSYLENKEKKESSKPISKNEPVQKIEGKNWLEYKDPHGFSVQIPDDWKVNMSSSGLVTIGPERSESLAFVWTIIFPEAKTNEQAIDIVSSELKNIFPDFKIINKRTLDKYQSLVAQFEYTGGDCVGAILISTQDKNAFISGVAEEKEKFNQSMPDLLKILSTFKYDRNLQNPKELPNLVNMVSFKDPNEGAFEVSVPYGWNVSGGLVRPYIDAGVKLVLTSENKGIQIENPYPPLYTMPNWALKMAGFTEGSRYNPSGGLAQDMIVMNKKNAKDYISSILAGSLGLSVQEIKDRPDLVEKVPKLPWITETTAAEAKLTGDGKIHKVIVIEQGMEMSGTGLWAINLIHYWAKENELALVEEIATAMEKSFVIDKAWADKEQAEVAKRVGIISQTGSEIADIISSTFEYQSQVQERAAQQWSDAMLGIERVYNPKTGEGYEVPQGAKQYWSNGYNIIGTEVSEPPTYLDDWTELLILK